MCVHVEMLLKTEGQFNFFPIAIFDLQVKDNLSTEDKNRWSWSVVLYHGTVYNGASLTTEMLTGKMSCLFVLQLDVFIY